MTIEAATAPKKPILFDDHTDLSKIELQYIVDARVGKKTCMAMCEFCWMNRPSTANFVQEPEEALTIINGLKKNGYKVIPLVSDSFAENGKYLKTSLFRNNDDWYLGQAAWTSGRPLIKGDSEKLLSMCVDNKIHTIIMTSHGTEDKERPFKGLTQPGVVREAVRLVQDFSERHQWAFRIILTFTISQRNRSKEHIWRYFDYCEELGVDVIRFNQFADVKGGYEGDRLSKEDVIETYKTLKETYTAHPSTVQMSVSEDFGSWGVEVMEFPEQVGHCVAGEHLFGVVYPYVYVCPVNLTLVAGKINENHEIEWDRKVLAQVLEAKKHKDFGGCIGVAYPHSQEIRDFFDEVEENAPLSMVV